MVLVELFGSPLLTMMISLQTIHGPDLAISMMMMVTRSK